MDSLVSTEWLARELGASDLLILDASYHLADARRDAAAEFESGHIPGAQFLDLAGMAEPTSPIDNTMPSLAHFTDRMERLGLTASSRVVVYDDSAIRSATRAWYMLRMFGLRDVTVLDGGLGKWKAEGRPLEFGPATGATGGFEARRDAAKLRSKAEVLTNLTQPREQLVDARGAGRFTGAEEESRPGLASGHIPGSLHLHYARLYRPDGTLKSEGELREAFIAAGVDLARPVVTTCGSGMTACILAFALHRLGKKDVALYDGSWTEWGADPATPKAIGPA